MANVLHIHFFFKIKNNLHYKEWNTISFIFILNMIPQTFICLSCRDEIYCISLPHQIYIFALVTIAFLEWWLVVSLGLPRIVCCWLSWGIKNFKKHASRESKFEWRAIDITEPAFEVAISDFLRTQHRLSLWHTNPDRQSLLFET